MSHLELLARKETGQPRRGKNDLLLPVLLEVLTLCQTTSTPSPPPEYSVLPSADSDRQCTVGSVERKTEDGGEQSVRHDKMVHWE